MFTYKYVIHSKKTSVDKLLLEILSNLLKYFRKLKKLLKIFGQIYVILYICHMKHSKFINLDYQSLIDLFKIDKSKKLISTEVKIKGGVQKLDPIRAGFKSDFDELEEKLQKISLYLNENKEVFNQLDELVKDFEQHQVLMNPTIHVARTKDIKTEIEYFTAKTFFPLTNGKRKVIKIHLGRADNYNFDTQNKQAKRDAIIKMRQTISRRLREGSL